MTSSISFMQQTPGNRDPYFSSVVLLAGNNSAANGTTTITDQSASAHTITSLGNIAFTTSQTVGGLSSVLASDGTGDGAELDGSSEFAYGTADFALEGVFRLAAVNAIYVLYDSRPTNTIGLTYFTPYINSDNTFRLQVNAIDRITGGTTISVNTWYYWAHARVSGVSRLYLAAYSAGGSAGQQGSDYSDTNNYAASASRPHVGINGFNTSFSVNGYWAAFRATLNGRSYSGASITMPTLPLPTS